MMNKLYICSTTIIIPGQRQLLFPAQPLNLTELISIYFYFLLANPYQCFYSDIANPEDRATLRSDPSAEVGAKWMEARL
jgi:hypothetical protein